MASTPFWVFYHCKSIKEYCVEEENPCVASLDGVLYSNDMAELISFPPEKDFPVFVIPDSVTKIGRGAFTGCTRLIEVVIPNSVTEIGENTFHGCPQLTRVVIPDSVKRVHEGAFSECCSLKTACIPSDAEIITKDDLPFPL